MLFICKALKLLVFLPYSYSLAFAASVDHDIYDIQIHGNGRTKNFVIERELGFKAGDTVSTEKVALGISNIQNTNLFSRVDYKITKDGVLNTKVEERWTTIPILKFSSGGGVNQTTLGVYDPNLFGRYLEAGVQLERLGDTNSGVVWFKNPRLFNSRSGIDLQYWNTNRLRTIFNQNANGLEVDNAFVRSREKLYFGFMRELTPKLSAQAFYEFNNDSFSNDLVSNEIRREARSLNLPEDTEYHFAGLSAEIGRINHNSYRKDGQLTKISFKQGLSSRANVRDFSQLDFSYEFFKTVFQKSTFAQRALLGVNDSPIQEYNYFLGGLDRIRGYSDGRFNGRYFWLSNTELRVPLVETSNYVLQTSSFFDMASVTNQSSNLDSLSGSSIGVGTRLILPKLYRFVVRLDYAVQLVNQDEQNISFGVQQFF